MWDAAHLEDALQDHARKVKAGTRIEALLEGRQRLRVEVLAEHGGTPPEGFYHLERQAFHRVMERLDLSHADIMAHQMSVEMAQNGDWERAWEIASGVFKGWSRERWQNSLKKSLLDNLHNDHQIMPL